MIPSASVVENRLLAVHLDHTDRIKTKLYLSQPRVRIHVVDYDTGDYIRRSQRGRDLTGDSRTQVPPIVSQISHFRRLKQEYPTWNQLLSLQDTQYHLCLPTTKTILFFELFDEPASGTEQSHTVAWAFLKLVGGNGQLNVSRRLRLQLFRAPAQKTDEPDGAQTKVFQWWKNTGRVKFNGSLFLSCKTLAPMSNAVTSGDMENVGEDTEDAEGLNEQGVDESENLPAARPLTPPPVWSRLPSQPCRIPNEVHRRIPAHRATCFRVKFSSDGNFLACALRTTRAECPIIVYKVPSFVAYCELHGHLELCHDINWSPYIDGQLLTASADCTARLWQLAKNRPNKPAVVFVHPTVVYCARLYQIDKCITADADGVIRLWMLNDALKPMIEISGHDDVINSMCLSNDLSRLITAGNQAIIKIWALGASAAEFAAKSAKYDDEDDTKLGNEHIQFVRQIRIDEIKTSVEWVSAIVNDNRSLVVLTSDYNIRVIDLRTNTVSARFVRSSSMSGVCMHVQPVVSPCGRWLFAPTSNASINVYDMHNKSSGMPVCTYSEPSRISTSWIIAIDYHPLEHMIVFAYWALAQPVTVYIHDSTVAELHTPKSSNTEMDLVQKKPPIDDYMAFNIDDLLAKHRLLLKHDSIDKRRDTQSSTIPKKVTITDEPSPTPEVVEDVIKTSPSPPSTPNEHPMMKTRSLSRDISVLEDMAIEGPNETALTLYDYDAVEPTEMSFKKGQKLNITSTEDSDWWVAESQGVQLYVPANYLQLIT